MRVVFLKVFLSVSRIHNHTAFVSSVACCPGDPILLWSGPQGSSEGPSGWVHYVKGAARSMTLLFLASLAMKCEWKLEILHPALFESMRVIWARRATLSTDIKRVAFVPYLPNCKVVLCVCEII